VPLEANMSALVFSIATQATLVIPEPASNGRWA
jgi:hypothetical protein